MTGSWAQRRLPSRFGFLVLALAAAPGVQSWRALHRPTRWTQQRGRNIEMLEAYGACSRWPHHQLARFERRPHAVQI